MKNFVSKISSSLFVCLFVCLELRPVNPKFIPPRNSPVTSVAATAKLYRPCGGDTINVAAAYSSSPKSFSSPISAVIAHNVNSNPVCSSGGNNSGYYASGSLFVAVTPDGQYLYACDYRNARVRVIKVSDNTIINADISVGDQPTGIAITPDGKYAYITNFDDSGDPNSISIIDTATNFVVSIINNLNASFGIAITPDGKRAYFTNLNTNFRFVNVINLETNAVIPPAIAISAGNPLLGIAITPDGKYAYVANGSDNSVSVIDIATNSVVGSSIPVGNFAYGIAITPDGTFAYVTNASSNSVSIINTITKNVFGEPIAVGTAPTAIAITPNNQYAYVTNVGDGTVSVINLANNSIVTTISIPFDGDFTGVIATPNSEFVYVMGDANVVYKISTATNTVVATIP